MRADRRGGAIVRDTDDEQGGVVGQPVPKLGEVAVDGSGGRGAGLRVELGRRHRTQVHDGDRAFGDVLGGQVARAAQIARDPAALVGEGERRTGADRGGADAVVGQRLAEQTQLGVIAELVLLLAQLRPVGYGRAATLGGECRRLAAIATVAVLARQRPLLRGPPAGADRQPAVDDAVVRVDRAHRDRTDGLTAGEVVQRRHLFGADVAPCQAADAGEHDMRLVAAGLGGRGRRQPQGGRGDRDRQCEASQCPSHSGRPSTPKRPARRAWPVRQTARRRSA